MNPHPKKEHQTKLAIQSKLRESGKADLDFSDEFFDRMHDRIMAKVECSQMQPPPRAVDKMKKYVMSKPWRQVLLSRETFALFLLVFGMTYQTAQHSIYSQWMKYQTREENLLAHALESPDLLHKLTDARPQNDFFVDVANHSMNDFEYEQLKQALWPSQDHKSKSQ